MFGFGMETEDGDTGAGCAEGGGGDPGRSLPLPPVVDLPSTRPRRAVDLPSTAPSAVLVSPDPDPRPGPMCRRGVDHPRARP